MSRFTCFEDACGCAQVFQKFKGGGEMSVSIEAIIENPCLLQPPALPPENSNFNLPKLEAHRNKYDAWYTYVAECTNGTFSSKTAASSTTSVTIERTTSQGGVITPLASSTEFVTDKITTKSLSTPVPVIPRTSQTAAGESSLLVILIPVVIVALVALVLAVLIYKFKSKIRKPCRSTGNGTNPPSLYDLEQHDKVNYVNNKAERGEYWRGKDPEDTDPDPDKPHPQRVNMVKPIHIRTDNGTATYQLQHDNQKKSDTGGRQVYLGKLPNIPDNIPSKNSNSNAQNETIYANHQFEKLARANKTGHSNPTFTDDESHRSKPLPPLERAPPVDNRMYYIDDSPYDRVDFSANRPPLPQIQPSSSKPVPTKRKRKPPNPDYDENAESVDV